MLQDYSKNKIIEKKIEYKKIQEKYDFIIPNYLLTELIKPNYDKIELCYLVNMAVINERFTEEEGLILKQKYCL